MRVLLGPPPALPRFQSKVPLRDQAPIAELGTLCLRLDSAPLRVASCGWGVGAGGETPRWQWHWGVGAAPIPPETCQMPAKPTSRQGLREVTAFKKTKKRVSVPEKQISAPGRQSTTTSLS